MIAMFDMSSYDPLDPMQVACFGNCNVCLLFNNHGLCRPDFYLSPLDEHNTRIEIFFALPDC